MNELLTKISQLKIGETCYPTERADETVTKTGGKLYPYYLIDRHGYEQCFSDALSCSSWMDGDRNSLVYGIHYI
ncbi:MAG: hypothetical protein PHV62_05915 [Sulfuricurvum sp.]|nr:hypothetical protein [Sulfuricurvum sp.]